MEYRHIRVESSNTIDKLGSRLDMIHPRTSVAGHFLSRHIIGDYLAIGLSIPAGGEVHVGPQR